MAYELQHLPRSAQRFTTLKLRHANTGGSSYEPEQPEVRKADMAPAWAPMELGTASDLGANIFETAPIPAGGMAMMGAGGTIALGTAVFAARDAVKSHANLRLLGNKAKEAGREARQYTLDKNPHAARAAQAYRKTYNHEWYNELFDRFAKDAMMGATAVVIGVGTYMAMGGDNRAIYNVANALTGPLGNAPSGVYGVANAMWNVHAIQQSKAQSKRWSSERLDKVWGPDVGVGSAFFSNARSRQRFAAMSGGTDLIAGVGAVLGGLYIAAYASVPVCVVAAVLCNYYYRNHVAFEHDTLKDYGSISEFSLINEAGYVLEHERLIETFKNDCKTMPAAEDALYTFFQSFYFLRARTIKNAWEHGAGEINELSVCKEGDVAEKELEDAWPPLQKLEKAYASEIDNAKKCISDGPCTQANARAWLHSVLYWCQENDVFVPFAARLFGDERFARCFSNGSPQEAITLSPAVLKQRFDNLAFEPFAEPDMRRAFVEVVKASVTEDGMLKSAHRKREIFALLSNLETD